MTFGTRPVWFAALLDSIRSFDCMLVVRIALLTTVIMLATTKSSLHMVLLHLQAPASRWRTAAASDAPGVKHKATKKTSKSTKVRHEPCRLSWFVGRGINVSVSPTVFLICAPARASANVEQLRMQHAGCGQEA